MRSISEISLNSDKFKVGVFCIDPSYIIYHVLSLGLELSRNKDIETYFLCTSRNKAIVQTLAQDYGIRKFHLLEIRTDPISARFPKKFELSPAYRPFLFWLNRVTLRQINAFITPLYDYLALKWFLKNKLLIFTSHGIANRAYSFDNRIKQFDLFFLTGSNEERDRKKRKQLTKSNYKVVGFLKFDLLKDKLIPKLFLNQNKTILYNPHWNRQLTSFHKYGFALLDFFSRNPQYNLIFAPHSRLITKNQGYLIKLKKYKDFRNILIDFESEYCNDMTYTKCADIYIGDASSQALEFIYYRPRPCIFIDAHKIRNDTFNRPIAWDLGLIIRDIQKFDSLLNNAKDTHEKKYITTQKKLTNDIFHSEKKSPSALAAEAVMELIQQQKNKF